MFDPQRVQQSWQREMSLIDAAIHELSEVQARVSIRNDGWTAQDILGHIATTTQVFLQMLAPTSSQAGLVIGDFDLDQWNDEYRTRHASRPFSETRIYWEQTSEQASQFLTTLTPEVGERPAVVPWLPTITTVGDVLRVLVLHTRDHRQELTQGLNKLATQAPTAEI